MSELQLPILLQSASGPTLLHTPASLLQHRTGRKLVISYAMPTVEWYAQLSHQRTDAGQRTLNPFVSTLRSRAAYLAAAAPGSRRRARRPRPSQLVELEHTREQSTEQGAQRFSSSMPSLEAV